MRGFKTGLLAAALIAPIEISLAFAQQEAQVARPMSPSQSSEALLDLIEESKRLHLQFDWKMPDRYGPDKNKNGIIDLPNSPSYVANKGDVPGFHLQCRTGGQRNVCDGPPRFRVDLFLVETSETLPYINGEAGEEIIWTVAPHDSGPYSTRGAEATVFLTEGHHRVTVQVEGRPETALTRTVDVQDHFIAVLGDSFGAGEGAPEKRLNFVNDTILMRNPDTHMALWADPGMELPPSLYKDLDGVYKETLNWGEMAKDMATYRRVFENMRSHRSSYTHGSQLARDLELMDERSSVTFVNLAQSGATIGRGMLGTYNGIIDTKTRGVGGELLVPEMRCEHPLARGRGMCPQMLQLNRLLNGQRTVDHIYMSIGGNDVGFANILGLLLIASRGDIKVDAQTNDYATQLHVRDSSEIRGTVAEIDAAVRSGRWDEYERDNELEKSGLPLEGAIQLPGLDGLLKRYGDVSPKTLRGYGDLAPRLSDVNSVNGRPIAQDVTLIPPPFFGGYDIRGAVRGNGAGREHIRHDELGFRYCRAAIRPYTPPNQNDDGFAARVFTEIDPEEVAWAHLFVVDKLTAVMQKAGEMFGWNVLEYDNSVYRHGLCAYGDVGLPVTGEIPLPLVLEDDAPWYNTPGAAALAQSGDAQTNSGLFHPNALGYTYAYQRLKADLRKSNQPGDLPWDLFDKDTDDQIEEILPQFGRVRSYLFELKSENDVQMFAAIDTMSNQEVTVTIERQGRAAENASDCAAIIVFDERGHPLATNSSRMAVSLQHKTAHPQSYEKSADCDPNVQNSRLRPEQKPIMTTMVSKVTLAPDYSRACKPPVRRKLFFGVSKHSNVEYDPITGRGDIKQADWRPNDVPYKGKFKVDVGPAQTVCLDAGQIRLRQTP